MPDNPRLLARFTKHRGNHGGTGYPYVRLVALLTCGTRTVIDAVFGPTTSGETTYTRRLLASLHAGMILLADRNFGAQDLIGEIAATGADVLIRLKNGRKMPILGRYTDGSYLSKLGRLSVRVIECEITISTPTGRQTGVYRLATTLLDHHRYPAGELITLYHRRWEIETAYLELKSSILGGRVLRARTPTGIEQEVYALLVVYHLLRTAMADATSTRPDVDPDRASFTIAWQTARDQVIQAAGVIADTVIDLVGTIGRHVLADLMPARRLRVCPRIVKRAISKYQARGPGHRPGQLQGHREHRHPHTGRPLTITTTAKLHGLGTSPQMSRPGNSFAALPASTARSRSSGSPIRPTSLALRPTPGTPGQSVPNTHFAASRVTSNRA